MWFVKELPDSVKWHVEIQSVPKGNQITTIHFSFEGKASEYSLLLPYPWAGNKPNGGFELIQRSSSSAETSIQQVKFHGFVRELREEGFNIMTLQDIKNAYTTVSNLDFGYVSFSVSPSVGYVISYKTKIDIQSCMFVGATLPYASMYRKTPVDFTLEVTGGLFYKAPSFLKLVEKDPVRYIVDKDHSRAYLEDIYIKTTNWESSDSDNERSVAE